MTAPPWSSLGPPQPLAATPNAPQGNADDEERTDGPGPAGPEAAPPPVLAGLDDIPEPPRIPPPGPQHCHPDGGHADGGHADGGHADGGHAARQPDQGNQPPQAQAAHGHAAQGQAAHGQVTQGQTAQGHPQQGWPDQGGWPAEQAHASARAWPAYPEDERPEAARRGRTVLVVAVAAVLVVLAVVAAVLVFGVFGRASEVPPATSAPPLASAAPKVSGPPPGDLRLRDESSTITLTWTDPSRGAVPFMVAGGRAGQKLGVLADVDPGETSYTVNGLNSRVDYCFTVLAVYSTNTFATSGQVCTDRQPGSTPS
ncbi:fibronectin type III domain-containing protein [Micromonospora sp. NPDC048830]|uniref:fibronectin type III domain-containing protein n=1 Tax=Micromonospora sp. NPDC048830 TaxID=3364257 RepID=UPI00371D49E4